MNSSNKTHQSHNTEGEESSIQERKKTIGEELFLVYLKRKGLENDEDDFDEVRPTERKRKISIGEELYQIHLKRSSNDADNDTDMNVPHCQEEDNHKFHEVKATSSGKTN